MIPNFFDSSKCGTMFRPDTATAAAEGRQYAADHNIPASKKGGNEPNIILSVIDMQADFINPQSSNLPGNLAVPGAVDDVKRLCNFIFDNVERITHIVASLDTHYLFQPFHQFNWMAGSNPADGYKEGDNPKPFTLITQEDIANSAWLPTRMPLHMRDMVRRLELGSKKQLCIWPVHCELGTPGHALDPCLMEAIHFHAGARSNQYGLTIKGGSYFSEHYGILQAEVPFDDDQDTQLNMTIVNKWMEADAIYFAGEAKSHCVLETLNQVAEVFQQKSPQMLERLHVLQDCTSSVADLVDENGTVLVPFDDIANDRFKELAKMGFKFVNSTEPILLGSATTV